jgi:serine/threonine-protein kinase
MELLDGEDLESIVRRKGRLPPDDVLEIMQPLCDALTAAHGAGIVHRDIKASNVMLVDEADGTRVVLLDFGVAKLLGPGEQGLTNSHHAIGTPTAMSPEQIAGGTVDARTDVYALGNLAFHLLTGELPFAAELSPVLMMHMHLHTQPPRPSQRAPVGNAFDEVVLRAMRKDAADRYPTASAFFDALRDAGEQLSGRGRAVAAGATRVIAVHVGLLVDEEHLENPDERLLDDLESVLPMAVERLNGRGFLTALETGTSLLLLRRISGDGRERDVLIAEVTAVLELHDALQYRAEKDERVHVNLCLHAGEAILAGSKVIGGAVTEVASWVPGGWVEGVVATAEAVSDLPLSVESVAEGCAVVRVIGVQGR